MTGPETRLLKVDVGKNGFLLYARRQHQPQAHVTGEIALRQQIVKRGDDFLRIALNAGHALSQEASVDGPIRPSIHAIVGSHHERASPALELMPDRQGPPTF